MQHSFQWIINKRPKLAPNAHTAEIKGRIEAAVQVWSGDLRNMKPLKMKNAQIVKNHICHPIGNQTYLQIRQLSPHQNDSLAQVSLGTGKHNFYI